MRSFGRRHGMVLAVFLFLWTLMAIPVLAGEVNEPAGEQRVFDDADLFYDSEIEAFEEEIAQYREELKADLVVVTTEDTQGKTMQDYADDFYDQGGFGHGSEADGVLFLIDMEHRQLTLSVSGGMIRILTDSRIEAILDDVYEGASQDDFVDSVNRFLQDVAEYHRQGIESGQYNYDTETGKISVHRSVRWYEALLALGVSAFTGVTACSGVIRQYSMKKEQGQAANFHMAYRADCNFAFHDQADNLVNKYVTSMIIPRGNNRGGGGGGIGGGGGSIAGRSSTHTSSSGRTHGGGSRGF